MGQARAAQAQESKFVQKRTDIPRQERARLPEQMRPEASTAPAPFIRNLPPKEAPVQKEHAPASNDIEQARKIISEALSFPREIEDKNQGS